MDTLYRALRSLTGPSIPNRLSGLPYNEICACPKQIEYSCTVQKHCLSKKQIGMDEVMYTLREIELSHTALCAEGQGDHIVAQSGFPVVRLPRAPGPTTRHPSLGYSDCEESPDRLAVD